MLTSVNSHSDFRKLSPDARFITAPLRHAGSLLCALLIQLCVVQSVEASCGDWLASHGEPAESFDVSVKDLQNATHQSDSPEHEKPCRGPLCQRAPIPLNLPAPAPPPSAFQQWLVLSPMVRSADFYRHPQMLPQNERCPESAFQQRLERPPCL